MITPEVKRARAYWVSWQFWVGLAIGLFFLYWAIRQASDLGRVVGALGGANYLYVIPALAAYFLGVAIRAVRWRLLLKPMKSLPARRLFPIVVIGYMANDILPLRMGEFVRAYVLGRDEGVSRSSGLATIFVERVFDGLGMMVFIFGVLPFVPFASGLDSIILVAGIVFVGAFLVALVVASNGTAFGRLFALVANAAPGRIQERIVAIADRFAAGFVVLRDPRAVVAALGLTLVAWLCEATMYYLLSFGFGLGLGFAAYVLTTGIASLGTMIPSSPGYVGTFEALMVFVLDRFGVPGDIAFGYTVALHALLLVPVTILGFYYMLRRQLSIDYREAK